MNYTTMRKIEIDAAHRVPEHGSGCRRVHGHRYTIEAHCTGQLATEGEQNGMTLDFKFLKEVMMRLIHEPCDHGMILRFDDPLLGRIAPEFASDCIKAFNSNDPGQAGAQAKPRSMTFASLSLQLYILPYVPTAENLARHWWEVLEEPVINRSEGRARLLKIRVWETPNCFADYPG